MTKDIDKEFKRAIATMVDDRTRAKAWKAINEGILFQKESEIEYGLMLLEGGRVVEDIIEKFRLAPAEFLEGNIARLREVLK